MSWTPEALLLPGLVLVVLVPVLFVARVAARRGRKDHYLPDPELNYGYAWGVGPVLSPYRRYHRVTAGEERSGRRSTKG
ncbi:MAG TPA: hypothetical protein VFB34_09175 [Chloroflexota bacterium]|nr:hypothetical protein [Chloroflexota bacterium]